MTAATTTEPSELSTADVSTNDAPTTADGIGQLLEEDRQIIIVTGKTDGRMSGFLADLTHGVIHHSTLLRIKTGLSPEEFHRALAGQLNLPPRSETPVQLASRVGHRLQQPAAQGRFVLLCEGADRYQPATLEAIRQISNYPVSIVLAGGHSLRRQLRRHSLAPLRQRITHELNLGGFYLGAPFWVAVMAAAVGAVIGWFLLPANSETETYPMVRIVAPPQPAAVPEATAASAPEPELNLILDTRLAANPAPAQNSSAQ